MAELAAQEETDAGFMGRILRLTCLAPDIIKSVLTGTQPADFILQPLVRNEIPPIWAEQRKLYGFPEISDILRIFYFCNDKLLSKLRKDKT